MVDPNRHDVHATAQNRHPNQETFFTRGLSPLMKHTYLYHDYAYGWVPETAVWSSRFADLDLTDYRPVTLGLLKKLEFMLSLYKGPVPDYEPKLNTEFVANGSFSGRYVSFLRRFAILPQDEFISFLLLTSMPAFNLLFWFRNTAFDIARHSLFSQVYTTPERHVELARYFRASGDYKPLFSRLDADATYTQPLTNVARISVPGKRVTPSEYESLANLSTILYFTRYDPALMLLAFYVPGLSITTEITPAVEFLMERLSLTREQVVLV
ncbi:conserved hypothetical pox protein [Squirrelpox virus]|uniref:Protein OPG070 n=1 Tax=Squirrelpox virus TaxID=240426 RepID=U3UBC3_9POXV|nr:conserved hypothetical pox protein [Squirrelpox virus]CCD83213.1 conserved hypothetical pox protein [Squirrelpox virus]